MALASGLTVAIWKSIDRIIEWKLNRKAKKEDKDCEECARDTERMDGEIVNIQEHLKAITHASKVNMHDRIKYLCRSHIESGEITFDDREDLIVMHEAYKSLGGNGHLDVLMKEVNKLTLKQSG